MPSDRVFGPAGSIANVVSSMNVRSAFVDGKDAVKVYEAACELVDYVRTGKPAFLEVAVYRVKAHSVNDADYRYRPKDEGVEWLKEYDPIEGVRSQVAPERQAQIAAAVDAVVAEALEAASSGPAPEAADALRGIYATEGLS
jgi:TPP-dependent pyruvate/acetoin dehydrogenase alpha subunit